MGERNSLPESGEEMMSLTTNVKRILKSVLPYSWIRVIRACLSGESQENREPFDYSSMVTFPSSAGAKGDLELPVYLSDKSAWDRIERRPCAGKVIYGFIFNHELDILEIALNTLGEVVDHFIILESTYTHFGDKKELHYHNSRERFKGFRNKIVHVVLDDKPSISQEEMTWEHEEYSRNCVGRAVAQIDGIDDDDLFIVVDADEIVDPRWSAFSAGARGIRTFSGYLSDIATMDSTGRSALFSFRGHTCRLFAAQRL